MTELDRFITENGFYKEVAYNKYVTIRKNGDKEWFLHYTIGFGNEADILEELKRESV